MPLCLRCGGVRSTGLLHASEGDAVSLRTHLAFRVSILGKSSVVPVGEPHFFSGEPELLLVEDAGVSYETVIEVTMQSFKHIDGIPTVGCSYTGKLANIRLTLDIASRSEVVLHVEAAIVS